MDLCVTSHIVMRSEDGTPVSFRETMLFLRQAGFQEIDYMFTTPLLLQPSWREDFLEEVGTAKKEGVRFRYAHLPFDYPGRDSAYGWEEFRTASVRSMELAVRAGVDCAAIHPRTSMTREYDAGRERDAALSFLEPYREEAGKAGLVLALENMRGPGQSASGEIRRFGTETDDLVRLADSLGIGICWDTGHGNISAQDQEDSLQKIGPRLRMVHINDNFAEGDVHLAPFLGSVDWAGVARGLKRAGYQGSLNLEVSCHKRPEKVRTEYARYMAASAMLLASMIENS